jgi:hypothetical protein
MDGTSRAPHRPRAHSRFDRCLGGRSVRAQSGFLHACDRRSLFLARDRRGHRLLGALFCEVIRDVGRHDHHQARLVAIGQKPSTVAQLVSVLQDSGAMRRDRRSGAGGGLRDQSTSGPARRRRNLTIGSPSQPAAPHTGYMKSNITYLAREDDRTCRAH